MVKHLTLPLFFAVFFFQSSHMRPTWLMMAIFKGRKHDTTAQGLQKDPKLPENNPGDPEDAASGQ